MEFGALRRFQAELRREPGTDAGNLLLPRTGMGVAVEGELEAIAGVEDGIGDEYGGAVVALDKALAFIRQTGVDSFAPAIGTAHGLYRATPKINFARVSEIVAGEPLPLGGAWRHRLEQTTPSRT